MADVEIVIKLSEKNCEYIRRFGALWIKSEKGSSIVSEAILNGTILTPDMLADLLMEERIRGELKQDISYSKEVINDVRCKLTVEIIDHRPCYCGAELREVWRESEE